MGMERNTATNVIIEAIREGESGSGVDLINRVTEALMRTEKLPANGGRVDLVLATDDTEFARQEVTTW